jgi:hypothetical protein
MAYQRDIKKSARRHFMSAQVLYKQDGPGDQPGCRAVAGYLFGIAGELAVKQLMLDNGMKPLSDGDRRDDPFFAHFPDLRSMLARLTKGQRFREIRKLVEDPSLFQNWDITMRYAPTQGINEKWVDAWKSSAEKLIKQMDTV